MTWHNQIVILKQQLQQLAAVIGSGLIQAIKPFVMQMNAALSGLISFAQKVVNALGKIFGWEMEVNTKGMTIDDDALEDIDTSGLDDIADGADNATQAVKKLKDQLQGFDKLNVLRTTTKNPTSGKNSKDSGSGASGTGAVSNGDISAGLKKTKGVFESNIDNLFDLGRYIGNSLKKALDKIPWNEVYERASGFGKGLAEFLNGLISPELFATLGKTVANSINTALHFLDSFGEHFNFKNFGKSLASGLTSFLNNIQWKTALSAVSNWGQGVADAINSFIKENDFKLVGESIANAIKTAITFWLKLGSGIKWKDIGQTLADTVNGAIENFPAKDFADTFDAWVQGIYDGLVSFLSHVHWDKFVDKIVEFVSNVDPKTWIIVLGSLTLKKAPLFAVKIAPTILSIARAKLGELIASKSITLPNIPLGIQNILWRLPGTPAFDVVVTDILEMLGDAFSRTFPNVTKLWLSIDALGKYIIEKIMHALETAVSGMFKAFSWDNTIAMWEQAKADFAKGGVYILKGLGEGLLAGISFLMEPIGNVFKAIWKGFCDLFGISSPAEKMKPIGKYIIQGIIEGFKIPDIKGATKDIKDKIFDIVGTAKTKFDEMKTDVGKKIGDLKTDAESKWGSFKTNLGTKMIDIQKNVSTGWSNIKSTTSNLVGGKDSILSKAREGFDNIKSSVKDKFDAKGGIKGIVSSAWTSIASTARKGIGGEKGDTILSNVKSAFGDVKKTIKEIINDIKGFFPIDIGKFLHLPRIRLNTRTWEGPGGISLTYPIGFETYRKAYNNPMMFTRPTLIPSIGGYKGFGDGNGGEMVYGHQNLMDDIRNASGSNDMTNIGNRQIAILQAQLNAQKEMISILLSGQVGRSDSNLFDTVRDKASEYTMRTGRGAFEF